MKGPFNRKWVFTKENNQEFIFTRKSKHIYHPPLIFDNTNFFESTAQKLLGIILGNRLSFKEY